MNAKEAQLAWLKVAHRIESIKTQLFLRYGTSYIAVQVVTGRYALGYPTLHDTEGHQAACEAFELKYGASEKYGLFFGCSISA